PQGIEHAKLIVRIVPGAHQRQEEPIGAKLAECAVDVGAGTARNLSRFGDTRAQTDRGPCNLLADRMIELHGHTTRRRRAGPKKHSVLSLCNIEAADECSDGRSTTRASGSSGTSRR